MHGRPSSRRPFSRPALQPRLPWLPTSPYTRWGTRPPAVHGPCTASARRVQALSNRRHRAALGVGGHRDATSHEGRERDRVLGTVQVERSQHCLDPSGREHRVFFTGGGRERRCLPSTRGGDATACRARSGRDHRRANAACLPRASTRCIRVVGSDAAVGRSASRAQRTHWRSVGSPACASTSNSPLIRLCTAAIQTRRIRPTRRSTMHTRLAANVPGVHEAPEPGNARRRGFHAN